jgi:hypothetical protein
MIEAAHALICQVKQFVTDGDFVMYVPDRAEI